MNNWVWIVFGGMNAMVAAVLAGWMRGVNRRVRFAAVRAAQAQRIAVSAHVRLDLHSEVLPVPENSRNTKVSYQTADLPRSLKAVDGVSGDV